MEDDAGKSIHEGFKDSDRYTYVDLNPFRTPLIEIVSDPTFAAPTKAHAYLTAIKQVLQYVEISSLRYGKRPSALDAKVSVRLKGAERFGTKAEVKNLNSFRFLKLAVDQEIERR
jgi:aspartyl-tRNA(Asn)/glutamyl-tRNA(Gln) amidotransferase subunit B